MVIDLGSLTNAGVLPDRHDEYGCRSRNYRHDGIIQVRWVLRFVYVASTSFRGVRRPRLLSVGGFRW